ncbi:MAG: hypothetical protein ACRDID_14755, partial [Ktedonobacterales bacterium]
MAWLRQTWTRFSGWFRGAGRDAQIGVVVGVVVIALVVACCACGGGVLALGNSPYGQQLAQQSAATETAQTLVNAQATQTVQAYALTHPTPTTTAPTATATPAPTSTAQ